MLYFDIVLGPLFSRFWVRLGSNLRPTWLQNPPKILQKAPKTVPKTLPKRPPRVSRAPLGPSKKSKTSKSSKTCRKKKSTTVIHGGHPHPSSQKPRALSKQSNPRGWRRWSREALFNKYLRTCVRKIAKPQANGVSDLQQNSYLAVNNLAVV